MPVLGVGGRLLLQREAPDPCVLPNSGIDVNSNTFESICPGYWSGDHVTASGFPGIFDGVIPGSPDLWASYYGSKWYLGPNRDQITSGSDRFYKTDAEDYPDGRYGDDADFYGREANQPKPGYTVPTDFYIFVDELGRVSFYETRCQALAGCKDNRIPLANIGGITVIAPFGSMPYQNAIENCYSAVLRDYGFSDIADSVTLESICEFAPDYEKPEANPNTEAFVYDNADVQPRNPNQKAPYWECVAELREYSLNLTAAEVDTSAVSEKFGTAVKSMVNGGGSREFFVDRKGFAEGVTNGMTLMKLLLMTEKGCKADAKFYLIQREGCGEEPCTGLLKGDLYYQADVLITQTAINLRPTELVAGTAEFVTTGDIRLLESS